MAPNGQKIKVVLIQLIQLIQLIGPFLFISSIFTAAWFPLFWLFGGKSVARWLPPRATMSSPLSSGAFVSFQRRMLRARLSPCAGRRFQARAAAGRRRVFAVASTADSTSMWPGALPHGSRVGVLGGGQLGRMLAIAAVRRLPVLRAPMFLVMHWTNYYYFLIYKHPPTRPHFVFITSL